MLNPEALEVALRKIANLEKAMLTKTRSDLQASLEMASARGLLHSSITRDNIIQIYSKHINALADESWRILREALDDVDTKYSDNINQEIEHFLANFIPKTPKDIDNKFCQHPGLFDDKTQARIGQQVTVAHNEATEKIRAEVASYTLKLKHKKDDRARSMVSIQGRDWLTVQVGDNNVATITANLRPDRHKELTKILLDLERDIKTLSDEKTTNQIDELLEIVRDGIDELKKSKPNEIKLRGHLSILFTTIQTIPALKQTIDWLAPAIGPLLGM